MFSYVKGKFISVDDAYIHVAERGFRFGDGVFETILIYESVPLFFSLHMQRLHNGIQALQIPVPAENITEICYELIQRNNIKNAVLRIYVSRGISNRGYMPDDNSKTTLVVETIPTTDIDIRNGNISKPSSVSLYLSSWRKIPPECLPVQCKLAQGIQPTIALLEAKNNNCDDALLCNIAGYICETTSSNIFWRKDDLIYTPDINCGLLAGITRTILCQHWNDNVIYGQYEINDLRNADDVFITNSIAGVITVSNIQPQNWCWQSTKFACEALKVIHKLRLKYWEEQRTTWYSNKYHSK